MNSEIAEFQRRLVESAKTCPPQPEAGFSCATCGDQKFVKTLDDGVERYGPCPNCALRGVDGLPIEFAGITLADIRQTTGNLRALEFARAFPQGARDLYMHGAVGTGKTMLACAAGHAYCQVTRRSALFARWPMTLYLMQPGNLPDGERRALERRLFKSALLILDDIGAERDESSDFTRRMALLIYEQRGDAGLRTILTSNISLDDLAQHQADDRLASRIAGRADVVLVTGDDQRLRIARPGR